MTPQSHPITSDDLNAYVDGTLAPEDRVNIDGILAGDEALRRELAELQATATLLGDLPERAPRRSFTLGAEHARPQVTSQSSKILQFMPVVRSLSVAAVVAFMVVAGSLFLDINGETNNTSQQTFAEQNEIMRDVSVTESESDASHNAEDAPAPESADQSESSMTERGDAASAEDTPMDDLTTLEQEPTAESGGDVAQSTDNNPAATSGFVSDDDQDRSPWIWASWVLGSLAVALAGLWFALVRVGRQAQARRS